MLRDQTCHQLSTNAKDESADVNGPEGVGERAERDHHVADQDGRGEDDGADADAEDAVDEKAAEEAEDHVRPRVHGVQLCVLRRAHVHIACDVFLNK